MAAGQIVVEIIGRSGSFVTDTARAEKSLDSFRKSVGNAGDAFKYLQTAVEAANRKIAASETETAEKRLAAAKRILEVQGGATAVRLAEIRALQEAGALTDAQYRKASAAIDIQNGLTKTYREQLAELRKLRDAGLISPTEFKAAGTSLVSKQPIVLIREQEAQAARESAAVQVAAAQKIVDAQNGITATYRAQLAALRELRDAGALTSAQFKQAGAELVAKQPISLARAEETAAAQKSDAAQQASARALIDTLNGVGSAYRKNLALLQDSFKSGQISAAEFQSALAKLNEQRPDIQRYKQQQSAIEAAAAAQIKSIAAIEAAETAATDRRKAALSTLTDRLTGVTAEYRRNLAVLQDSLKAGDITPKQFQTKLSTLNDQQNPGVLAYREKVAAAQKAAAQEEQAAKESSAVQVAAAQKIIDVQNGLTAAYRQQLVQLRELRDAGALSPAQFKQAGTELVNKQPVVRAQIDAKAEAAAVERVTQAEAFRASQAKSISTEAAAQANVFLAFKAAEVAAVERVAAAEARAAAAAGAVASASERSRAAQQAAYDTKTAFIAKINEENAALFRSKDAQRTLDAERAGLSPAEAQKVSKTAGDREFLASIREQIAAEQRLADQFGKTATEILRQEAAERGLTNTTDGTISRLEALSATNKKAAAAAEEVATADANRIKRQQGADEYIAKVNEETAALFRNRDAQREIDALRAGVGPRKAMELVKDSGDAEFLAGIHKKIEAEEKLAAAFGKTEAAILSEQAAERGISSGAAKPIARLSALTDSNKAAADTDKLTKSNEAYIKSVNARANAINADSSGMKLQSQLIAEEAAAKGLTAALTPAIRKIEEFEKRTGQAGKGAFATANQLQTLRYTFSDIVASAGSGISPLTILLQQGPQLAQVEGGISGIFKSAISLITPFRLAMGGAAAAVGILAYALYQGAQQSKDFKDAIVLSGNFAGLTEGKFNALTRSIAAGGEIAASTAREFGQALISTGEISGPNFDVATEAAARYGKATGKTAKEVAEGFASMSRDVTGGATKMNESLNFLTLTQLQHIRSLQDQGKVTEALGIVLEALNGRLKKLEPNLGSLDRLVRDVTVGWKDFWDTVYDVGREQTLDKKLLKAKDRLFAAVDYERSPTVVGLGGKFLAAAKAETAAATAEFKDLAKLQEAADDAAKETGKTAELTKLASASSEYYRAAEKSTKSQIGLQKELNEEKRHFETLQKQAAKEIDKTGKTTVELPTPALRAAKQAAIRESYKNAPGASEADAQRKADLAADLQFVAGQLAKEQDILKFNQAELQAIYAAGTVSLKEFYDAKEAAINEGVQKELNALIDEQARIEVELERGRFKDPHQETLLRTDLAKSVAKSADIDRDAQNAAKLATYDRTAAQKALTDSVVEYRAQLKQLQGDEAGAAALRAQQAIANAKLFQVKSRGTAAPISDEEVEAQARAIILANAYEGVQRRVSVVTADAARAEEILGMQQEQRGASLLDSEREIFESRSRALDQLMRLRDAALEVASVSDDPRLKQAAADLALQVAKAADTVEPALNRLRAAVKSLASDLASSATDTLANIGDITRKRYEDANKEVEAAKSEYDKRIEKLQEYLSKSSDLNERARLKEQIARERAARDAVKVDKADVILKTLERDILGPMIKKIQAAALKVFITDPLEKKLQGVFAQFTGTGQSKGTTDAVAIAKAAQDKALAAASDSQKTAALETANALKALADAANGATSALGGKPTSVTDPKLVAKYAGTSNDPTAANFENEMDKESSKKAAADLSEFGKTAVSAASDVVRLAESAGAGGKALSLLPRIIQLIQSASTLSSSSSSGLSSILRMFGGSELTVDTSGAGNLGGINGGAMLPNILRGGASTGTNELERDMILLVHKGESITPKAYNPAVGNPPGNGKPAGGNVYITNTAAATKVSAQRDDAGDWRVLVEAAAEAAHNRIAADHASGTGRSSQALKSRGVNLSGNLSKRA